MNFNTESSDAPSVDYLYFTLEDGKTLVTEDMPGDHSLLWRHDFRNCSNSHLSMEEHKIMWGNYVKKRKLITRDGYSIPRYDVLEAQQAGLYHNPEFLILSTQCKSNLSFYLLDGIIPDEMKNNLLDDKSIQNYIEENAEQLYSVLPSKVISLRTFGITPKHAHADSTYQYHIYELSDLLDEKQLYYVEVACRHNNRIYYAFKNENIARRFVKDYRSWEYSFCHNRLTE